MITRKMLLLSVSLIAILFSSTLSVAIPITPRAYAQQKVPGANWEFLNGDQFNTNSNPQTQINKDNVELLELKWIFPIPTSASSSKFIGAPFAGQESAQTPPLVVDGIVYIYTNFGVVYALDGKDGRIVWSKAIEFNYTASRELLPLYSQLGGHMHGLNYIDGKIWVPSLGCSFTALDALTGAVKFQIKNICKDVPGNAGYYEAAAASHPPKIVKRDNVLIWAIGSAHEGRVGGRAFVAGYDLNTGNLLWRFFLAPPSSGDPEWAVKIADKGWIQGVKASDILARCPDCLRNDWGKMGDNQGLSNVWGSFVADEETGIVYMGTSQPGPDYNATFRPGPNLFGSSVIALRAKTGELVWWYQTTTHDLWDYDCSWNTILGKIGERKAIFKGCKNGVVHALDAANGAPIWTFRGPNIKYCDFCKFYERDLYNPVTYTQKWMEFPNVAKPHWMNPQPSGGIESDIAFDGKRVYAGIMNNPTWRYTTNAPTQAQALRGGRDSASPPPPNTPVFNSTLYAIDIATGRTAWSFYTPDFGFRGGIMVSAGVVFMHSPDSNLYMLESETGKLISKKFFGQPLLVQPTIGATADGKMRLYIVFGRSGFGAIGQPVPGALMSFGLPDKITQPQVITKEVIKEVPKEVVKEVVKEVPRDVIKEVIKEVPKEVVKEVPKEVTKTVTVETISPISYAVIGVGVVLIVVAGVMMSRRKKV